MRGSIIPRPSKRKGRTVYYGKVYVEGRQVMRFLADTKKEAEARLAEWVHKIETGKYRHSSVSREKVTFGKFADDWLEQQTSYIKPTTAEAYKSLINRHLRPFFGRMRLNRIALRDVDQFVSRKVRESKVSNHTVCQLLNLLSSTLKLAVRWGYIASNPAAEARRPPVKKRKMGFLDENQARVFLEHVPDRCKLLFKLALSTGMRRGELLAMKWHNLDLHSRRYYIVESFNKNSQFTEPKTPASRRTIDLTPDLVSELRLLKVQQEADRLINPVDSDQGLVFCHPDGRPFNPVNLTNRVLKRALKAAGLPTTLRFHDLRHSYVAMARAAGVEIDYLREQLGHCSPSTTMDIYSHLTDKAQVENQKKAKEAFQGLAAV